MTTIPGKVKTLPGNNLQAIGCAGIVLDQELLQLRHYGVHF